MVIRGSAARDVAILTYESKDCTVVLDGNHRLAALFRDRANDLTEKRLIVFQLKETTDSPGTNPQQTKHTPENDCDDLWYGFNPDVYLAKGSTARSGASP